MPGYVHRFPARRVRWEDKCLMNVGADMKGQRQLPMDAVMSVDNIQPKICSKAFGCNDSLRLSKLRAMFDPSVNKRGSVERWVAFKLCRRIARSFNQINVFLNICVTQRRQS